MPATKNAVGTSKFYDYDSHSEDKLNIPPVNCLPGEKVEASVQGVLSYNPFSFGQTGGRLGVLFVTNFRLGFRSLGDDNKNGPFTNRLLAEGDIALANIDKILLQIGGGRKVQLLPGVRIELPLEDVEVHCKDLRLQVFCFKFAKVAEAKRALTTAVTFAYPIQIEQLFAFQLEESFLHGVSQVDVVPDYYAPEHWLMEVDRQEAKGFCVTDINKDFFVCRSMPPFNIVPQGLNMTEFETEEHRFPVWSCSYRGASVVRVPYTVDVTKRATFERGIKGRIDQTLSNTEVFDLTKLFASARELQLSFEKLRLLCMPTSAREYEAAEMCWYSTLEATGWPDIVLLCLEVATNVASDVHAGTSVLLAERDHRDWTPLVCCLVQLMLEPRWRTIKGVQELIQREWVALGHDFTCRLGLLTGVEADNKQSPFFLLFLNCVWQLAEMFPSSFEFSETYLVTVWDTVCLGLFRTFIFSSAEDVARYSKGTRTRPPPTLLSAWLWSHQFTDKRIALFRNPIYTLCADDSQVLPNYLKQMQGLHQPVSHRPVLIVKWHASHIHLWSACFLRWLTPLHFPGGGSGIKHYTRATLADEMIALGHDTDAYVAYLKGLPATRMASRGEVARGQQQKVYGRSNSSSQVEEDKSSWEEMVRRPQQEDVSVWTHSQSRDETSSSSPRDMQRSSGTSCDSLSRAWSRKMSWAFPFVTDSEHEAEELSLALSLTHHARLSIHEPLDEDKE